MANNEHSAKVRLWLGNIIWVHTYVKFEENMLNTSAVIIKTSFEQSGMLHKDLAIGPKTIVKKLEPQVHTILKEAIFGNFQRYSTF